MIFAAPPPLPPAKRLLSVSEASALAGRFPSAVTSREAVTVKSPPSPPVRPVKLEKLKGSPFLSRFRESRVHAYVLLF